MIISHEYRYVFIEIPNTGSWSIHNDLLQYYGGQPILHKHATYSEFRNHATREERGYFVFAAVRNALDTIVSRYLGIKNNKKEVFTNDSSLDTLVVDYVDIKRYHYFQDHGTSFEDYFRRFYKIPYSDMIDLSARHLDYVIRFEDIQKDFTAVLENLGIVQVQPLSHSNKTPKKNQDFLSYYTPSIVSRTKHICGPFMKKWGYQFPENWGNDSVSLAYNIEYEFLNQLRYLYTVYLRYNNASYAVLLRKLRARLLP